MATAAAAAVKAISKQREGGKREVSDDIKNCTRRRKWRHKGEQRLLGRISKTKRRSLRVRVQLFMKYPGVKIKAM